MAKKITAQTQSARVYTDAAIVVGVVFFAAFLVRVLFTNRFVPTHDGEYHILRMWQFSEALSRGEWFPRWATSFNSGFGSPVFTFQYPFANYVASGFHLLGLGFVRSFHITMATGYVVALVGCYAWLTRHFDRVRAFIGTMVGASVPYWFVDIYVRGSVGEVWAIACVFWALYALSSGTRWLCWVSAAALVFSHNILAMIGIPFLLLYAGLVNRTFIVEIVRGVLVATVFWYPALYELRYVTGLNPVRVFDYFPYIYQLLIPSWGTGFRGQLTSGNEMSYQIGVFPLTVFVLSMVSFARGKNVWHRERMFLFAVFAGAVFCMTQYSVFFWRSVPAAAYIQYPWRLLSFVVITVPYLSAALLGKRIFAVVFALVSLLFVLPYTNPASYEPRSDSHYMNDASFAGSTSSLGNAFQTRWFDSSHVSDKTVQYQSGNILRLSQHPTRTTVHLTGQTSGKLTLPYSYYPMWFATVDEKRVPVVPDREGRVSLFVPEGEHVIDVWLGNTWWQIASSVISGFALLSGIVSIILSLRRQTSPARARSFQKRN